MTELREGFYRAGNRENTTMRYEGSKQVLENLIKKRDLLNAGDPSHTNIRPLLLIGPGAMNGVDGGGQIISLEKFGLSETFDAVVGNSTGVCLGGYFLSQQSKLGVSIYPEECTTPEFFSKWRVLNGRPLMDADWLAKVFRGEISNKKLEQTAIKKSRSKFYGVVTDAHTGRTTFLNIKNLPDMVQGMRASFAVPGLTSGNVNVSGQVYLDGGKSTLPLRQIIKEFKPTDVLILSNRTEHGDGRWKLVRRILGPLFLRNYPLRIRTSFSESRKEKRFRRELNFLRAEKSCRIGVIWADRSGVNSLTQDSKKLQAAIDRSERHLSSLLRSAEGAATLLPEPEPRGSIRPKT